MNWEPEVEDAEQVEADRRMRDAGIRDKDELFGLLQIEWIRFEERMDLWSRDKYRDTGVMVPDSSRSFHRRAFHALLQRRYGYSYVDPTWEQAHPPPKLEPRAGTVVRRSNMSSAETLAAVATAKLGMGQGRDVVP